MTADPVAAGRKALVVATLPAIFFGLLFEDEEEFAPDADKQRRALHPFLRKAARLPAKSVWVAELLVRPDDTPLRMNGSGMLLLDPPWKLDDTLRATLPAPETTQVLPSSVLSRALSISSRK